MTWLAAANITSVMDPQPQRGTTRLTFDPPRNILFVSLFARKPQASAEAPAWKKPRNLARSRLTRAPSGLPRWNRSAGDARRRAGHSDPKLCSTRGASRRSARRRLARCSPAASAGGWCGPRSSRRTSSRSCATAAEGRPRTWRDSWSRHRWDGSISVRRSRHRAHTPPLDAHAGVRRDTFRAVASPRTICRRVR